MTSPPPGPPRGRQQPSSKQRPQPGFPGLTLLCGLIVPFLLAHQVTAQLAALGLPPGTLYLAEGGFVLFGVLLVAGGFLVCRPLTSVLAGRRVGLLPAHDRAGLVRTRLRHPGVAVSRIGLAAVLAGTVVLLLTAPEAVPAGTAPAVGAGGIAGQILTGLGAGVLAHRVLEGGTGSMQPPLPGTRAKARSGPGLWIWFSGLAVLLCVYRYDLALRTHLAPVMLAGAVLVHQLARPDLPSARPGGLPGGVLAAAGRLGPLAPAVVLLLTPVRAALEGLCGLTGPDPATRPGALTLAVAVPVATLFAARALTRAGRQLREPMAAAVRQAFSAGPHPEGSRSLDLVRTERTAGPRRVDLSTIPDELRLLPLPRRDR